jgi:hypothetical protein
VLCYRTSCCILRPKKVSITKTTTTTIQEYVLAMNANLHFSNLIIEPSVNNQVNYAYNYYSASFVTVIMKPDVSSIS